MTHERLVEPVLTAARLEDMVLDWIGGGVTTLRMLTHQAARHFHPDLFTRAGLGLRRLPVTGHDRKIDKVVRRWESKLLGAINKHLSLGRIRTTGRDTYELV